MRWLLLVNGVLLVVVAGFVVFVQIYDRDGRAAEVVIQRYAGTVRAQDLAGAVGQVAPDARDRWSPWIAGQLGNIYEIKGIAVRRASILEQIARGAAREPTEATVILDVNRGFPDAFYQATTRVGLAKVGGAWYLAEPLLSSLP